MRVLYFHQHFSTPDGSSGTRSYQISKQLLAAGHDVTVVCGSAALCKSGLSGPFSEGKREGRVDGIQIVELELPYSNYDSLLVRSWTFLRFAFRSVMLALRRDYDVVFATSTPLTAALPGIAARCLRRKPFVFEVRDLWPELPRAMGVLRNPFAILLLDWLEFAAYHSAHACIALSPGIAQGILKRGIPEQRVVTAPNGCDLDLFAPDLSQDVPQIAGIPPDAFVATFTGAHGLANGLGAVLDAAAELRDRGRDDIFFVFVGDGKEKPALIDRVHRENLNNCVFVDPMPKKLLAQFLCRRANLGLMILSNVPAFYYGTSPNKFFDYLASALPVLVNYPGWMAEMATTHGIGVAVPPDDSVALARAVLNMADDPARTREMGQAARELAHREFDRSMLADRCVSLLENVADTRSAKQPNAYQSWGKRSLDIFALLLLLPFAVLVTMIVAFAVWFCMDTPVFFRQVRPGYRGKPFTLVKFRTMDSSFDEHGKLLSDENRLTKLGKVLRRYSLDEVPQLWNVLMGHMSLVGPRPLLMQYLQRYNSAQARRHDVKPGITGWAQVNGRNAITWEKKFALDEWYVDHHTMLLDLKILFRTIWLAIHSQGITQPGHATAEEFLGSPPSLNSN